MSIKHRLHQSYKVIKHWDKWQTNWMLRVIRPFFNVIRKLLIVVYQKLYLPLKRSRPGRSFRTFVAKVRRSITTFDLTTVVFDIARFSAGLQMWRISERAYRIGLARESAKGTKVKSADTKPKPAKNNQLSLINRVYATYRKLKYSNMWQTNWFLRLLRPLFMLCIKSLILIYQKVYLPIRRSRSVRALRTFRAKQRQKRAKAKIQSSLMSGVAAKRNTPKLEYLNEAKFNISVMNRLVNINRYKNYIKKHNKLNKNPRIAVFTAIAGGYDTIKLPEVLLPDADYFLFTDRPAPDAGVYKIRPLPYYHVDTPRMTRYVKTHPHKLLAGYDIAIWVDANILITGDITPLIASFTESKKAVGAVQHPLRNTLYQEADACIAYNKEDERLLKEQVDHYKDVNYNTNDLIESNIMMFDLRNDSVPKFFTTWWSEIDKYTRRDQISLNYSLDKNNVSWHKIIQRPQDARNHPLFALVPHSVKQKCVEILNESLGEKMVNPYEGASFAASKDKIVKAQRSRKIDVVYCVYNALDDVKICLESVVKHRKSPNLNLIIVDDGSDTPTADFLKDFQTKYSKWVKLLRNESASGYTKAANTGLKASTGELVILLNSDTIVTDGWSEKMADAVYSTPGAGIVGPLSSAASHQSIPNHIGGPTQTATNELPDWLTADDVNKHCEEWSIAGFYPRVPLVHGFCFGVAREVIDKVGFFDEDSFPNGYGEENDYCFRATDAGFGLVLATNTYIFHAKSKSYADDRRIKLMKQGNAKLRELRGKGRIERAIKSVLANPYLNIFRSNARALYKKPRKNTKSNVSRDF